MVACHIQVGRNRGQCETGANATLFFCLRHSFCTEEISRAVFAKFWVCIFDTCFGVIPHLFRLSFQFLTKSLTPKVNDPAVHRYLFGFLEGWQGGGANREVQDLQNTSLRFAQHFWGISRTMHQYFSLFLAGLVPSRHFCAPFSGGISHWGFARCWGITLHFRTATGLASCLSGEWKGFPFATPAVCMNDFVKVYWSRSGTTQFGTTSWYFWAAGGWGLSNLKPEAMNCLDRLIHWGGECCWYGWRSSNEGLWWRASCLAMIKDRMDLMGFFSHGTDSIWIYSSTFYSKNLSMGGSEADHASTGQRWPQEKIPRLLRGPMRRGTIFWVFGSFFLFLDEWLAYNMVMKSKWVARFC